MKRKILTDSRNAEGEDFLVLKYFYNREVSIPGRQISECPRAVSDTCFLILSKRQKKFLTFIKGKESNITTIQEYLKKMKVSYETARTDLSELTELGIFRRDKKGKKYIYKYLGLKGYKEY